MYEFSIFVRLFCPLTFLNLSRLLLLNIVINEKNVKKQLARTRFTAQYYRVPFRTQSTLHAFALHLSSLLIRIYTRTHIYAFYCTFLSETLILILTSLSFEISQIMYCLTLCYNMLKRTFLLTIFKFFNI